MTTNLPPEQGEVVRLDGELAADTVRSVPTAELARLVAVNRVGDVRVIDTLTPAQRDRVTFIHRHVHEVLNGTPPDAPEGMKPSPHYDPALPLSERIATKAAELRSQGVTGLSQRSLWRKVTAYRDGGLPRLVDKRSTAVKPATGYSDPRLVALMEKHVVGQTMKSTRYQKVALTKIQREAELQGIPVPSRATMYRLLATVDGARGTFGLASTRRTKANQPTEVFGSVAAFVPGAIVEIDSTPLDVRVVFSDGSVGRPDLTYGIDLATRSMGTAARIADI